MSAHTPASSNRAEDISQFINQLTDDDATRFRQLREAVAAIEVAEAQRWKDTLAETLKLPNTILSLALRTLLHARLQQTRDAGLIKGLFRITEHDARYRGEFCFALMHAILDAGERVDIYALHALFRPIYRELHFEESWQQQADILLDRLASHRVSDLRCIYFLSALAGWQYRLADCLKAMLDQANLLPTGSGLRYPLSRWINYAINTDPDQCQALRAPCRQLYDGIMDKLSELAATSHQSHSASESSRKPKLLVAFSSFWDFHNAPTWIIFNYLRDMAQRLPHLEIHILNTDGRHYPMELFSWIAPSFMNRRVIREEEILWQQTFFKDCPNVHFLYWSDQYPMHSVSGWETGLSPLIDYVQALSPDLILAVHYELLGQAFLGKIPTIHYPMTTVFSDWLKTDCQIYWGNAPLDETYAGRQLPIPRDRVGIQRLGVNPSYGDSHAYSRMELGLPEDATVVISVGTRLEREITPELATSMASLMKKHEKLHWLLVGTGAAITALQNMQEVASRVVVRSFDSHVEAVYPHCDIYLNPPRPGGGFSAAMAMYHHVPVLNVGTASDVGMYLASEFIDQDMENMMQRLDSWLQDAALRKQIAERQRERLLTEFSISRAVDTLLPVFDNTLRRFWQEKHQPLPSHLEGFFALG